MGNYTHATPHTTSSASCLNGQPTLIIRSKAFQGSYMITQLLPNGSFDQGYNSARSLRVDSQPGALLQKSGTPGIWDCFTHTLRVYPCDLRWRAVSLVMRFWNSGNSHNGCVSNQPCLDEQKFSALSGKWRYSFHLIINYESDNLTCQKRLT